MHWCFSSAGSKKSWECNAVKRKSVLQQIDEQAKTLLWVKRNYNSWLCSYSPSSATALDRLQGGHRVYVWSLTVFCSRYFVSYFQLLRVTERFTCFCLLGGEIGIKEESPVTFFVIPLFACPFSVVFFFLSLKASSALLYCCDNVITWWLPEHACGILHWRQF